jgi:hypothetical protein
MVADHPSAKAILVLVLVHYYFSTTIIFSQVKFLVIQTLFKKKIDGETHKKNKCSFLRLYNQYGAPISTPSFIPYLWGTNDHTHDPSYIPYYCILRTKTLDFPAFHISMLKSSPQK